MSGKRYPEEFKIQAVEQVTKQGHSLTSVAERLGVSYKSLSDWVKRYDKPASQRKQDDDQAAELRRLRAKLKRVTQERDILKEVAERSRDQCNTFLDFVCWCFNFQYFSRSFV